MDFRVLYDFNMQYVAVRRETIESLAGDGDFFRSPFPTIRDESRVRDGTAYRCGPAASSGRRHHAALARLLPLQPSRS